MKSIIGQKNLLHCLKRSVEESNVARFTIIAGERGSQSNLIAPYLANLMKCDCIVLSDVKVDTMRNMTSQAYQNKQKIIYSIENADTMSPNAKNAILKVVEEPPNKAYFIMTVNDLSSVPDTLCSRARIYHMESYTPNDIKSYLSSEYGSESTTDTLRIAGKVCKTPGEVDILMNMGAVDFYEYTDSVLYEIVNEIGAKNLALLDKLSVKEDDGKYDIALFLHLFQKLCLDKSYSKESLENGMSEKYLRAAFSTSAFKADLRIRGINNKSLVDTWCLLMRQIFRHGD